MSILAVTKTWAEMIKIAHSVFALPFALVAAILAGRHLESGKPSWGQIGLIVLCMVAARCVAMTFNRIVDCSSDAGNPRTANRPLPAGLIHPNQAWVFWALSVLLFIFGCLVFLLAYRNPWPIAFALPVLTYLCGYSYSKRFTRWSHFYLGSAIALSPAAAWLAIHPDSLGLPALILVGAVTFWIGGFDIIYACQDIDFDRRAGLYSLPASAGATQALWIARAAHVLTVLLLALLGVSCHLGWLYWVGVVLVATLLLVENAIVHPDDFSKVNLAFFTINGIVSIVLGAVTVTDVLLDLEPVFAVEV